MQHEKQFYIDGQWVDPIKLDLLDVIDPSTEEPFTQIAVGSADDVDRAVAAARAAFPSYGRSTRKERIELLSEILAPTRRSTASPPTCSRPTSSMLARSPRKCARATST